MSLKNWKVYCATEDVWVLTNSSSKPNVCPNDAGHSIRSIRGKELRNFSAQDSTYTSDTIDLGYCGKYNNGVIDKFTGLFRDASDGKYKLYCDLEEMPIDTVNTGGTGYTSAHLEVGDLTVTGTLTGGNSGSIDIAIIKDVKSNGTNGGSFNSGSWRERDLQTLTQTGSFVSSLSGNEFTLISGTYLIDARCPGYDVNDHKARLYNVSDSSTELVGINARADDHGDSVTDSCIKDIFTIASSKTFRIEHRCDKSNSGDGFGLSNGYGVDEIYTTVSLTKI